MENSKKKSVWCPFFKTGTIHTVWIKLKQVRILFPVMMRTDARNLKQTYHTNETIQNKEREKRIKNEERKDKK